MKHKDVQIKAPPEPTRIRDINKLKPEFAQKVKQLLSTLESKKLDPVIVETLRTRERQAWLYGIGRWHSKHRKPVTHTLNSRHLTGEAVDIISRKYGYRSPRFFSIMHAEAKKLGIDAPYSWDKAHLEMTK